MIASKKTIFTSLLFLTIIFLFWLIQQAPILHFIYLLIGYIIGNLVIELDNLSFWYLLDPHHPESQIGQKMLAQRKFTQAYQFLLKTKGFHQSFLFHHIFPQLCLTILNLFLLSSSDSILAKSLVFFAHTNLFLKQILAYFQDKTQLQTWLFARLNKQLPLNLLPHYLLLLSLCQLYFLIQISYL